MATKRPLYDELSRHSFEAALGFLASRRESDNPRVPIACR